VAEPTQPPPGSREERIAYNEAWRRHLNERTAKRMHSDDSAGFRCECWQVDCDERIQLSGREWEEVHSKPTRFAVTPGHTAADLEAVIERYPHFWVLEKRGEAGEVAEKLA
jgi:hypothetical protein